MAPPQRKRLHGLIAPVRGAAVMAEDQSATDTAPRRRHGLPRAPAAVRTYFAVPMTPRLPRCARPRLPIITRLPAVPPASGALPLLKDQGPMNMTPQPMHLWKKVNLNDRASDGFLRTHFQEEYISKILLPLRLTLLQALLLFSLLR